MIINSFVETTKLRKKKKKCSHPTDCLRLLNHMKTTLLELETKSLRNSPGMFRAFNFRD